MTLIAALVGCAAAPQADVAAPPAVSVSEPVEREVVDYEEYTGRTAAVDTVGVRARVSGYLVEVHFAEGSIVEKGDLLFRIDPRPFESALGQARGLVAQWEAKLARAEADASRNERLRPTGAASQRDLDVAVADRGEARAALQSARAAADRAALDLEFTRVTAPIRGRISRYLVTEGNLVNGDVTLMTTIVSIDPMYAYFDVDETTMLRLRQSINAGRAPAIANGTLPLLLGVATETGFPHQGTIDFVDNQVDPKTGTLRMRGVFANEDDALVPGAFVRVRVPLGAPHHALMVSDRAIGTDQGQKVVYVVGDRNEVSVRPVDLGRVHDGLRVITDGVTPGERVMVSGLLHVEPGGVVDPTLVEMPHGLVGH